MSEYVLNVWYPLRNEENVAVAVPEKKMTLFKNEKMAQSFHLGVIHEGNFFELNSRLGKLHRRYDFSIWNAWGSGFGDPTFSPTHFMLLE